MSDQDDTTKQRLEQALATLEQTARLTELGRLVAEMAHEMRQPLLGIKAFAQMVSGKPTDPEYVKNKVDAIVEHSRRMEAIMERVLRYASGDGPKHPLSAATDVNDAASQAMDMLHHVLRRARVDVSTELGESLPAVAADSVAVQEIFVNLIANARDAFKGQPGVIRIVTRVCDGGVESLVSDDGPGISAEIRQSIFEPFVTSRAEGTGLGLYISRKLARNAGGSLELVDGDGPGATFRIFLPAEDTAT